MATQRTWLLVGGLVAAAVVALYLGVPPGTLLIVGVVLLCPLAMYFGMGGMHKRQDSEHAGMHANSTVAESKPGDGSRPNVRTK